MGTEEAGRGAAFKGASFVVLTVGGAGWAGGEGAAGGRVAEAGCLVTGGRTLGPAALNRTGCLGPPEPGVGADDLEPAAVPALGGAGCLKLAAVPALGGADFLGPAGVG